MISSNEMSRAGSLILAITLALGASSCTTPTTGGSKGKTASNPTAHCECYWKGDGVGGSPSINISLSEQCIRYYKGGQLVGVSPISSGREGHSTPAGSYRIIEKDRNHRSSLYGAFCDSSGYIVVPDVDVRSDRPPPGTHFVGAEMPCFMRITGAAGMHEGYLPGYPASHGCIRLPGNMAEIFFRETPHGTPVKITGDASEAPRYDVKPVVEQVVEIPGKPKTKNEMASKPKSDGGFFSGSKKPKTPPQPRGVTLYLE